MKSPQKKQSNKFRIRAYATFIFGDSFIGTFAGEGATIAVLWYVVQETDSGAWLGIIAAAKLLPAVIGSFISGPAVSWVGSRRLVVVSRVATTIAIVGQAILMAVDALTMPLLALLSFGAAMAVGPSMVADTTRFPEFTRLARIRLARFNALDNAVSAAAGIAGLLMTAWLIEAYGLLFAFSVSAGASVIATIVVGFGFPADNTVYKRRLKRAGGMALMVSAGRYATTSRVMAPVLLASVAGVALLSTLAEIIAPLVVERSRVGPEGLSAIFIVAGLTSMIGSAIYAVLEQRIAARTLLIICLVLYVLSTLTLAVMPLFAMGIAVAAIVGLATGILDPVSLTFIQSQSPTTLRGGILGVVSGLQLALALPVVLAVGFGETLIGLSATLFGLALVVALSAVPLVTAGRLSHEDGSSALQPR